MTGKPTHDAGGCEFRWPDSRLVLELPVVEINGEDWPPGFLLAVELKAVDLLSKSFFLVNVDLWMTDSRLVFWESTVLEANGADLTPDFFCEVGANAVDDVDWFLRLPLDAETKGTGLVVRLLEGFLV
jgi:hypothetical protein